MSLKDIQEIASSQVVFAILFIMFLVWYLKKSSDEKKQALDAETDREQQRIVADKERDAYVTSLHKQREEALMLMMAEQRTDSLAREAELSANMRKMADSQERIVDQQERIGDTLKEVSTGLTELEKKVDNNVLEIWKVMAQGTPPTK